MRQEWLNCSMNLETLQSICKSYPHVEEDLKWGADICYCIAGKMFLVTSAEGFPIGASFKCSDEEFETLVARPGFKPAAYLARYKWAAVDDIDRLSKDEWERLSRQAYELVKAKLPKKIQKELEGQ